MEECKLQFNISGEWITGLVREWFYLEGKGYDKCIEILNDCMSGTDETKEQIRRHAEDVLLGGIEVEGYLRKASAEELKDYQRYYLAFEECEKYYYVTYKKSGKPDKELYFDERSVLSITWAGKPFEKIIDGEKRWDIEIVRA